MCCRYTNTCSSLIIQAWRSHTHLHTVTAGVMTTLWLMQHTYMAPIRHGVRIRLHYAHARAVREGKERERRENPVNIKCLQASRQAGGWRLLSEAICYAPAVLLFSHLSSYISIPPFFSSLPISPSLPPSLLPCLSAWSLYLSNLLLCVCAWLRLLLVCVCVCVFVRARVRACVYPCVWVWVIRLSCSITVSTRPPYAVFCCLSQLNTMSLHN